MNHCTCLVVGALCMFKWLPCFALLRRKSGNACCNHYFSSEKQWTRSTVHILLQPCTKLLTFTDVWDSQHRGPPAMH